MKAIRAGPEVNSFTHWTTAEVPRNNAYRLCLRVRS
jgi:hypothetical protein